MEEAVIAGRKPVKLELKAGTRFWCSCGLSESQPWCDGSHKGTGFRPVEVTVDVPTHVAMCTCKRSKNGAFCDGSHRDLPE